MHDLVVAVLADSSRLLACVITFAVFFLIARVVRARQPIALAFAFTPLLLFFIIEGAARSGALSGLL